MCGSSTRPQPPLNQILAPVNVRPSSPYSFLSEDGRGENMATTWEKITIASSLLFRLGSYIFFRWVPGHPLPPILGTLFAIYLTGHSIIATNIAQLFDLVDDKVEVITRPAQDGNAHVHGSTSQPAEELDVQETVTIQPKHNPISTLLTGLPSTSRLFSLLTLAINFLLLLGVIDVTYRTAIFYPVSDLAFVRLGYVSNTSAKIQIREPNMTNLPIFVSYRYADVPVSPSSGAQFDGSWHHAGSVVDITDRTDFTTVFTIDGLRPDTRYQYALSNNYSGYIVTAPGDGRVSVRQAKLDPAVQSDSLDLGGKLTFLHSSCLKARFPYNPIDHPLTISGLQPLAGVLSRLKPAFFLFLGDFIYVDVPRRHGDDKATYRREYRQVYASPEWPTVSHVQANIGDSAYASYDLPWLHVYDDHEIANDWSANTTGVFPAAFDSFDHYHIAANPPLSGYSPRKEGPSRRTHGPGLKTDYYTTFNQGPASFFLLDTRRYRSAPCPTHNLLCKSTMLGESQLKSLLTWLHARPTNDGIRWKVVVTSVPFTRNWRVNAQDAWGGYLSERRQILEAMWYAGSDGSGTGVIILSGDRHEHATTAFPPSPGSLWDLRAPGGEATPVEFSTSPLSMFYLPYRTYREDFPDTVGKGDYAVGRERETCLKYAPEGNSKFGAIEIESPRGSEQSILRYRLFIDGEEKWSHVLVAPEKRRGGLKKWKESAWE